MTDLEREHVMSGNLDQLVEEQRRVDEEKDAEVRGEERGCGGGGGGYVLPYSDKTPPCCPVPRLCMQVIEQREVAWMAWEQSYLYVHFVIFCERCKLVEYYPHLPPPPPPTL